MGFKVNLTLYVLILLAATNCTIQKRAHRSGYYFDWHKKSTNTAFKRTAIKTDFVASADQNIFLPSKEKHSFSSQTSVTCGDTLYLLDGKKIICQVTEINESDIKYNKCDNISDNLEIIKKKEVVKIVYLNKVVEVFTNPASDLVNFNCSDTIYLESGRILICKVIETTGTYIKYKKCEGINNAEYYLERSKIKAKPVLFVNKAESTNVKNNPTEKKKENKMEGVFSIISFLFFMAFLLMFFGAFLGLGYSFIIIIKPLIILSALSLVFGIIGKSSSEKYYNLAQVAIIFSIIALITFLGILFFLHFLLFGII